MKTTLTTFVACCLVGLLSSSAQTTRNDYVETSGNAFLRICGVINQDRVSAPQEWTDAGECVGYLSGLIDGLSARDTGRFLGNRDRPPFCLPSNGIDRIQPVRIVLKFIKEHPEKSHLPTAPLAAQAMIDAFPCSGK